VVFVSNQEVVLIDYKTGKPLAKHQQQLQEYESILKEMQLKVVKKILVYLGDQCNVITL
jgi:ATP-dependent exoDNAse (exonuclease V) beta subunit